VLEECLAGKKDGNEIRDTQSDAARNADRNVVIVMLYFVPSLIAFGLTFAVQMPERGGLHAAALETRRDAIA
jgi:hypothetical protein